MKRNLFVLILGLLAAVLPLFSQSSNIPAVRTAHAGAVESLSFQAKDSLLFSAGDDGTVRVWDNNRGDLIQRMQVSHLPVKLTALHPSLPRIACLETDGINTFIISVWDYLENRRVSTHRLQEMPLFLTYSPRGTYLVYGRTDWDSLRFLDGSSGRRVSLLEGGFGIVSAVFFSGTEKTLLTYGPSGSLQYWDLTSLEQKTRLSTEGDLRHMDFTANGRFMVGERNGTIYLINLVNGKVLDTLKTPASAIFGFDGTTEKLLLLSTDNQRLKASLFTVTGGTFSSLEERSFPFNGNFYSCAFADSRWYIGTAGGDIYTLIPGEKDLEVFAENGLHDLTDLAAGDTCLALTGAGISFLIPYSLFHNLSSESADPAIYSFEHPFPGAAGISHGGNDSFYLWPGESKGDLFKIDGLSGQALPVISGDTPFQQVFSRSDGTLVTLDKNNTLKVLDLQGKKELFSYSSFGIQGVVSVAGGSLMAGRNKTSALSAPLLLINPSTGETVPLQGDTIVTFDLIYDENRNILYSLGIENRGGVLKTVLKSHSGANWEKSRTLLAFSGEDHAAAFALDRQDYTLYASLGYGHLRMYRWGGFTSLQKAGRIPKKLEASGGYLFALSWDNTLSVWSDKTGRLITEISFLKNGDIIIADPDGTVNTTRAEREIEGILQTF
ncbi:MAG: hypothetical protein JW760_06640 [Spirochaetales bacterium]|nr:hypothetical protein [Spirochaetales bacterium]